MNLDQSWKIILKKAWSVRLALLSAGLSALEVILPLFVDSMPRNVFAALAFCTAIAATIARIVAQPEMDRD